MLQLNKIKNILFNFNTNISNLFGMFHLAKQTQNLYKYALQNTCMYLYPISIFSDKYIYLIYPTYIHAFIHAHSISLLRVEVQRGGNFKKSRVVIEWKGKEESNLWVYISCWLPRLMAHSFSTPGLKVFPFFQSFFFFLFFCRTIFAAAPDEASASNALGLNWNSYRTFQSPFCRTNLTAIRLYSILIWIFNIPCILFFSTISFQSFFHFGLCVRNLF